MSDEPRNIQEGLAAPRFDDDPISLDGPCERVPHVNLDRGSNVLRNDSEVALGYGGLAHNAVG